MIAHSNYVRRRRARELAVPPYSLTMVWDPDDRIFVVTVPELPGCKTHGATYEEAATNAREAIASWVGAAEVLGEPLPEPRVERYPLDDEAETREMARMAD
jgi:predicted RNase H-like HicB family nuclease